MEFGSHGQNFLNTARNVDATECDLLSYINFVLKV